MNVTNVMLKSERIKMTTGILDLKSLQKTLTLTSTINSYFLSPN